MLKNLLKSCLAVAMIGAMAAPTFAADVKTAVNGRVQTVLVNEAVKDGTTTTEMLADGRFGGSAEAKVGAWTVSAFINTDLVMDEDGNDESVIVRDQKITFENEALKITAGRFSPWGVTAGGWDYNGGYMAGQINNTYWVGENMATDRKNHVQVGVKSVGVNVVLGMNHVDSADATMDAHNRTTIGLIYSGTFGPLSVGAQFVSDTNAIDEEDSDATTDGEYDGGAYSSMALGVKYAITDGMAVSFDYESGSDKAGNADDATTTAIMELLFDMALDKNSGVSFGYSTKSTDDGSENIKQETRMNLAYSVVIGPARIFASYFSETAKDDDIDADTGEKTDSSTSKVGFGAKYEF